MFFILTNSISMEVAPTMIQKEKGDILAYWIYQKMLDNISIFASGSGLGHTITKLGFSSNRGFLPPYEYKMVCSKY